LLKTYLTFLERSEAVSQTHLVVSETTKTWHGSYLPNYRKKARTGHAGTGF
jgi:hypothetical protein